MGYSLWLPESAWMPPLSHRSQSLQIGCRYLAGTASTHQSLLPCPNWSLGLEQNHPNLGGHADCSPQKHVTFLLLNIGSVDEFHPDFMGEERPSKPDPSAARRGRRMQGSSVGRALGFGFRCEISRQLSVYSKPRTNGQI